MQKLTKTLVIMGLMTPFSAGALGIGEIRLHSALNQRLNAEIAVIAGADEPVGDVQASLASPAAFAQAGIERPFSLNGLRFEVVTHGKGRAPTIKITSADTIREPFLNFLVELQWPQGRVTREFTLLLDPPSTFKNQPSLAISPAAEATSQTPAPAPSVHASPERLRGTAYGPVRSGETLWSIAKVVIQTQRITPEQMVMALFETNPQAFAKPNINAIQPGATLRVPDLKEVRRHSAGEAKKFFDDHNLAWRNKTEVVAVEPSMALLPAPSDAKTAEAPFPLPAAPDATVTPAAAPPVIPEQPLTVMPVLVPPVPVTALQPAETPAAQPLAPLPAAQPTPVPPASATVPATPAAPPAEAATPAQPPAAPATPAPKPPVAATPPKPKPKPAVPPRPPAPPPPPASFWDELLGNTFYLSLAGVFVVVLGLASWAYQRRRAALAEFDKDLRKPEVRHIDVTQASVPDATAGSSGLGVASQQQGSFLSDFTPSDFDVLDTDNDAIDPISEADVYLAYGRYSQAEELIRQAINENPFRDECKLKLLEVFYTAQNREAFEKYAAELLEENKNNDQDFWARVVDMGSSLAPGNPMFGGVRAAAGADQPPAALTAEEKAGATTVSAGAIDAELESLDFSFDLDDDVSFLTTASEAAPEDNARSAGVGESRREAESLRLPESTLTPDQTLPKPEAEASAAPMAADSDASGDDISGLTFDLGDFSVEPVEEQPAGQAAAAPLAAPVQNEDAGLEFNVEPAAPSEATAAPINAPAEDEGRSLAFDLGGFSVEPATPVEAAAGGEKTAAMPIEAAAQDEDPGLAFDLGDFKVAPVAEAAVAADDSEASLEFDVSALSEGGFRFAGVTQAADEPAAAPVKEEAGRTLEFNMASTEQDAHDAESALISELLSTESQPVEASVGFDMSTLIPPVPAAVAPADAAKSQDSEFDFDMNFDMSNPLLSGAVDTVEADAESVIDLGDMDDAETKLDLAKAYIDMENHDAAKLMLEEVLEQGNERQKQDAQAMLKQLG